MSDNESRVISVNERIPPLLSHIILTYRVIKHNTLESYDVFLINGVGLFGFFGLMLAKLMSATSIVRIVGYRQYNRRSIDPTIDLSKNPTCINRELQPDSQVSYFNYIISRILMRLDLFILNHSDGCITVSSELKHSLVVSTNLSSNQVISAGYDINVDKWKENHKKCSPKDATNFRILSATNFDYMEKMSGACLLTQYLIPILAEHDDVEFIIAGSGQYLSDFEEFIDQNIQANVRNQIKIRGQVDDMNRYYSEGDIFTYFSFIDGLPNVVYEAQASGLPVICNRNFGMQEQVTDGHTGYLVELDDRTRFESCIRKMINEDDTRKLIGNRSQRTVGHKCSKSIVKMEMRNAIMSICANNRCRLEQNQTARREQ